MSKLDSKVSKLDSKLDSKLNNLEAKFADLRTSITIDIKALIESKIKAVSKEIKAEINTLQVEFTKTTDFLAEEQKELKVQIESANNLITKLSNENLKLQNELTKVNQRTKTLEKISRSHNVEIQAVPEKRNENLEAMFEKLCSLIKVPYPGKGICPIRRIAKLNTQSNRLRTILVTMPSERHRDCIISGCRRYNKDNKDNPLDSTHLGVAGEKRRFYIAEHSSPECKELHAAARQFKKDKNYQYVWVVNDRVYLRKNDATNAIHVKSLKFLSKIEE
ncbi:hypothetical protein NE865_16549 [Phthorimaea operculella]|nr:hypothetical protein NE865_16549 [Phthorimaea operculella]